VELTPREIGEGSGTWKKVIRNSSRSNQGIKIVENKLTGVKYLWIFSYRGGRGRGEGGSGSGGYRGQNSRGNGTKFFYQRGKF
jgi:hypothetical protein